MLGLVLKKKQKHHLRYQLPDSEQSWRKTWRYMTLTYSCSLTVIAVLSIAAHLMLDQVIQEQGETGRLVNISGQQRMLSQRSSSFGLEYLYTGSERARLGAKEALEKLLANHRTLLAEHDQARSLGKTSPLSLRLQAMYFSPPIDIDAKIQLFAQSLTSNLDRPWVETKLNPDEVDFLQLARQDLLNGLHTIVGQYELESTQRIGSLRKAQSIILWIVIFVILIEAVFVFRPMVNRISYLHFKLWKDATHDALSGLLNRKAFFNEVSRAIARNKRTGEGFSVILLDLDFFKRINDQFGHIMGDRVIEMLGLLLRARVREIDSVARLGGEEFGVLLCATEAEGAMKVAEDIRQAVCALELKSEGQLIPIRVSGGVTAFQGTSDDTITTIYARADAALYKAKLTGRNQVCVGY